MSTSASASTPTSASISSSPKSPFDLFSSLSEDHNDEVVLETTPLGIENSASPLVPNDSISKLSPSASTSERFQELPSELQDLFDNSSYGLDSDQKTVLKGLLWDFVDIFSLSKTDIGRTSVLCHKIDTGQASPIKQPPRKIPLFRRAEAENLVAEMLDQGVIQPSESPWSSPVVLVKKKDGSLRFCIDYRKLNEVTKKDSYPLPRIDLTLEALGKSSWFASLDLISGYFQVEVDPADKEKTAFSMGSGLYEFNVMPFGLTNAPATFQRLMEIVLKGIPYTVTLGYLDDLLVHSVSFPGLIASLSLVFQRLRRAGLKLSPKKCHLCQRKVKFLGHVVSEEGLTTDPDKITTVESWPVPTSKKDVQSFLGLCAYYRRFVKDFSAISKPLTALTEKNARFVWTSECQNSFDLLKNKLITAPVLSQPNGVDPFVLDTDASYYAWGAVLSQVQDGNERVIEYYSKTFNRPERNYCVTRKELLAVVKAIAHFQPYLLGRKFLLRTDHASLRWLMNFKEPEGQIARWIERLQEFDFSIQHRPGKNHGNADALSRRPCELAACVYCSRLDEKQKIAVRVTVMVGCMPQLQEEDTCLKLVRQWLKNGERPTHDDISAAAPLLKQYWSMFSTLVLKNDVACRSLDKPGKISFQILVPQVLKEEIIKQAYDFPSGGHLGVDKTPAKVRERYYWPS